MSTGCDQFRSRIPRALLADLDPAEQKSLENHLAECAPCARERELYVQTLGSLRSLEDVPAPRHFLVHPQEHRANPWSLFRSLAPAWQVSVAACVLLLVSLSAVAASRLQARMDDGALTLGFGRIPPARAIQAPVPAVDTAALEAQILNVIEERNRKEKLEWVRTLRAELARSQSGFTRGQLGLLQAALGGLESRMSARVDETARTLDEQHTKSLATLYQAIRLQQDSGLALVDAKLNRLAISGEKKSSEIDAILETILQVAELNTTQSPREKR